jgi:hypothetical protein
MKPGGVFEDASFAQRIATLEYKTGASDFWTDSTAAEKVMGKIKTLKNRYDPWKELRESWRLFRIFCSLFSLIRRKNRKGKRKSSYIPASLCGKNMQKVSDTPSPKKR